MSSTIYDVAKLAGVSTATVSRVINNMGNVNPSTIVKVETAMNALNFTPNSLAQSFSSNRSFTIGLVTSIAEERQTLNIEYSIRSNYYTELLSGINCALEKEGYSLLIINSLNNSEKSLTRLFNQKKIDGLIVSYIPEFSLSFGSLIEKKVPMCYIGHILQFNKGLHVYAQYYNYLNNILSHFKEQGHKRVLFICLRDPKILIKEWESMNYKNHKELQIEFIKAIDNKSDLSKMIRERFLGPDIPTAVFSENLIDIQPIISSLNSLQLSVPDDVSLISVEHIKNAGNNYYPRITNVYVPVFEIGQQAAKLLLDYMTGKLENYDFQINLESCLIKRNSVKKLT